MAVTSSPDTSSGSRVKAVGDEADVQGMDALAAALTRSSLLVLGGAGLAASTWLAFSASRRKRDTHLASDRDLALSEAEHERDVSIARAAEATERERLARERLATLAPLEARLEIAERRALDAQFDYLARRPELVALLSQGGRAEGASFAPAIKQVVVLLAEGQGRGEVRDDLDPHVAAAQALVLMIGYLRHEAVIAASAPSLIADEPALRERWRKGVTDLVVNGVRAAP